MGCVPILFDVGAMELPWEHQLDYSKFTLRVAGKKIPQLKQLLLEAAPRLPEMRHALAEARSAFVWQAEDEGSPFSRLLREPMMLAETGGRSPSVLNGGLEQATIPLTLAVFAGLISAVDIYLLKLKAEQGSGSWNPELDEEFEDKQGTVMNRKTYTDLARQGLLD